MLKTKFLMLVTQKSSLLKKDMEEKEEALKKMEHVEFYNSGWKPFSCFRWTPEMLQIGLCGNTKIKKYFWIGGLYFKICFQCPGTVSKCSKHMLNCVK